MESLPISQMGKTESKMLSDTPYPPEGALLVAETGRALLSLNSEFIFTLPEHCTHVDLTRVLQYQWRKIVTFEMLSLVLCVVHQGHSSMLVRFTHMLIPPPSALSLLCPEISPSLHSPRGGVYWMRPLKAVHTSSPCSWTTEAGHSLQLQIWFRALLIRCIHIRLKFRSELNSKSNEVLLFTYLFFQ